MSKSNILFAVFGFFLFLPQTSFSQIPNNSKKFLVSNYYYPDSDGNYQMYLAHGYATPTTSATNGKLFLLPILELLPNKIQYFDTRGFPIDRLDVQYEDDIKSIKIPVKVSSSLPNSNQLPAIGAALENSISLDHYEVPLTKNINGGYVTYTPNMGFEPTWKHSLDEYHEQLAKQKEYVEGYSKYDAEIVDLSGLKIEVYVDDVIVGVAEYPDSFIFRNGITLSIRILNPTVYQKNMIAGGEAKVIASYKFRNANVSVINARFDAKRIIDSYLLESQRSLVRGRSSGFQFFGIGNRKKKLKSYFNQSIDQQISDNSVSGTTIEMFDATEAMINRFNEAFFPRMTKRELIENHIAAASKLPDGDRMKELHLKYASSLKLNDPNLEVDVEGALASLAANDYAGFIAKGLAVGSNRISGNSEYLRTISSNEEISRISSWSDVQAISIQHSLQEQVSTTINLDNEPYIGIIRFFTESYRYPLLDALNNPIRDVYGNYRMVQGIGAYIYGVVENGPAHNAGLQSGMFITSLDGSEIRSRQGLLDLLKRKKPGDRIKSTVLFQNFNGPPILRDYYITLLKGFPN